VSDEAGQIDDPVEVIVAQFGECLAQLEKSDATQSQQLLSQSKALLQQLSLSHRNAVQVYASLLNLVLYSFVNYIPVASGSTLNEQLLDLIQKLQPPLSIDDLDIIYNTLLNVTEQLNKGGLLSLEQVSLIVNPLVMEFSAIDNQPRQRHAAVDNHQTGELPSTRRIRSRRYLRDMNKIGYDILDAVNGDNEPPLYRGNIKNLQQEFIQQLRRAVLQISQFSKQLERDIAFIYSLEPRNDIDSFKHSVVEMLQSLRHGHEAIALNFDGAKSYLKIIESGSQQLMDELDHVRVLSLTDELTGLPNRRAFLRRVNTEVDRIVRYKHPLSLVLIDLDYFKRINDQFGHAVGDDVLRIYAESVFPLFRNHDLVARYGGEEFVILFPDTDIEGVQLALQKIREKCATLKVKLAKGNIPLPGFSAGVAQYLDGESAQLFIERADRALYRAKQNGRGRTEVANVTAKVEMETE